MKVRIAVVALLMFGMSACAYKTCPTYAKKDVKEVQKVEQKANM